MYAPPIVRPHHPSQQVLYDKHAVQILDETSKVLLQGWSEPIGARLWRFSLRSGMHYQSTKKSPPAPTPPPPNPKSNNAYIIPSVNALVRFLHAEAGFPVKSTWIAATRPGNYRTWLGLTYNNAKTYHTTTAETLKGHITQTHQGVRSTNRKTTPSKPTRAVSPLSINIPATTLNELYMVVEPISKLYTDDMGRFPIRSRSGHRYIMLAFHCDSNVILIEPFKYRHD